jgi:hypothetical protein
MIETGTFPIGFEFEDTFYKEFSVRPLKVKDTLDMPDSLTEQEQGLYVLAKKLQFEDNKQITYKDMLEMYSEDFAALTEADKRLTEKLTSSIEAQSPKK